ncbi:rhomboid family intramembrane serine protease [Providencia sp. PROV188]|jgi:membrane associated rhomboid family serine protease|uniref:rhomboid family intramembrane serine protease n=1 Tax=Providencia TaxID=586 RepID=UPI0003E287A8|nr:MULTISPECIES: rhomboid family intramembrane serine protease [Providencia]ETT01371.1 peptidase, S54 family [Providencia alcalifaciens PAL-3]EUC99028.1 peptidase, S54 family [Providencia alcalifaciens PAL-1]MDR2242028.1 rhomboid family intramembrane serine protease [Providencia alcalifaciens]MTB44099.1 rhomboid family intramembrane serine protease [Providencia sp. wls1950]MTC22359.1 rhomboid family intramembrane serine protease [Providencia sp. wls1938]
MQTWLSPRIKLLITLAGLLITIQIANSLSGYALVGFGIQPRTLHGLVGIIFAPLIHGDWAHLLSNLPPLLVLSALLLHDSIRKYAYASAFIIVVGGLIVWLVGRNALHIGASGWIFGLWGLLIAQGFFRRKLLDIIIALLVLFYFGAMASGLLPVHQQISTESHIAGAIAGITYAWLANKKLKATPPTTLSK